MTNTLLRLRKPIPEPFIKILLYIQGVSNEQGIKSFVIGAFARDLIFEFVYDAGIRLATADIDFGIAVESWDKYERLRKVLVESGKFRNDNKQEQRVWWTNDSPEICVDLIPYGGLELPKGQIRFPPTEDFAMSTLGFQQASEDLLLVLITRDQGVEIVSSPGLVLLKFVAYNDRPVLRRRDIQDIWFVIQNYLKAGNEDRLYVGENSDLSLEEDFDYRTVGARLLGRDLAPLLTEATLEVIERVLDEGSEGGTLERVADIINRDRLPDDVHYRQILTTLGELRRGIKERLALTR